MKKRLFSRIFVAMLTFWVLLLGSHSVAAHRVAEVGGNGTVTGYIALTFDDGPSGDITRRLLRGLEEREARATFFLCGYRLEQYQKVAPLIAGQGHEIGLHGYSHKNMKNLSPDALAEELERTQALVVEQTGKPAVLLRPPGGCCGEMVEKVAGEQNLAIINWSIDPKDWADHDVSLLVERVVSQAKDGDIILMHDMWRESVDAALEIVERLQGKGYVFVTVSELAALKGTALRSGQVYSCLG